MKGRNFDGVLSFYEKHYKKLMIFSILLLVLSFVQIGYQTATTGFFLNRGVSLKGGISVTVTDSDYDAERLQSELGMRFVQNDIEVLAMSSFGTQTGLVVNADIDNPDSEEKFVSEVKKLTAAEDVTVKKIGSSLAEGFFKEILITLLVAFIFMAFVVFMYFKNFVPSAAVVLSAITDITVTLAIVNVMGMKLSSAGIAAFLMLLGYSVDTDILLTTRVVKTNVGSVFSRVLQAMKTGLTMTATTVAAVGVGLVFSQSATLKEIMIILMIGLCVDVVSTWIQNAGILRLYMAKKESSKK
ncbi:protein translocase subunit SecF [Candidatus Woesearchaeota archaeon]|nr:protein translocase subunit SecF [Candidatus Woesearchaeota archaeon]